MELALEQSSSAPSLECDPYALIDLIERVEFLPEDACGALLIRGTGKQEGSIYVEHARVCWAVARGMGRRLTDLVRHAADGEISREQMEALYQTCRAQAKPLGQTLVEQRVIDADKLRVVLARHTAEALLITSRWARPATQWVDRQGTGYDAMFTFDPVEIASWVGALLHERARAEAVPELRAVLPDGCFGAAFNRPESYRDHLPIAVLSSGTRPLSTVIDLGKWAHNTLDLAQAAIERCSPVTAIAGDGQAAVAWVSDWGFCAALCQSVQEMARLLSNHRALVRRSGSG